MKSRYKFRVLLFPLLGTLAACGGGGGGGSSSSSSSSSSGGTGSTWQPGVYLPSSSFDAMCAAPRAGTSDRRGTATDENNWLRSWTNELYLWYGEVTDRDPSQSNTVDYFRLLKTNATTPSGQAKDKFHFTYDTEVWRSLSQGGVEAGYGAEFAIFYPPNGARTPRRIVVAFTEAGTPAAGQFLRGDEILQVDGADAVNGDTQAIVNTLNAGLFPSATGQAHNFLVRGTNGTNRTVSLTSASITHIPVPIVTTFGTPSGQVGYIQFNDHIATAETPLMNAITFLDNANVTDLILDLRYNGGGYLDLASELAYMIGNTTLTAGRTFEKMVFNDKNPSRNPITGETLAPTPFHSRTQGFTGAGPANLALPTLNLNSVYIITGPGTCSASESIINSLRGVGVQVYLIGSTTCGKPYGFYPTDNCGTTYFTIQFRGENAANFGDYTDGFSPANTTTNAGTSVPGCSVADDFNHALGDVTEARIAAALSFRASNNQTCPLASGSSDPRVSKASFGTEGDGSLWVSKPAARLNRIVRRM
ncbi:MAG TPA: S41 family peptidase [Steroidobacteraceae bacterium]|nr:S41 family peptidase [Steroidobacteraceae bacterium]